MTTLSRILRFNFFWGVLFLLFQGYKSWVVKYSPDKQKPPYDLVEYQNHEGKKLDYFVGYLFFIDAFQGQSKTIDNLSKLNLGGATYARMAYILVFVSFWMWGLFKLFHIYSYLEIEKIGTFKKTEHRLEKPFWFDYFLGVVTTALSLYGIYYSIVYCTKFWLQ